MNEALKQATKAFYEKEIPIGAVVVINNIIIAKAHNLTERLSDTTAHAEMLAITSASEYLGAKYLDNATIFVTIEPCIMCVGALYWSKISKIVYGATDNKRGFHKIETVLNKKSNSLIHKKTDVKSGILEQECALLMKNFFLEKRKKWVNKKTN